MAAKTSTSSLWGLTMGPGQPRLCPQPNRQTKLRSPRDLPAPTGAGFSREARIEVTRWNPFSPRVDDRSRMMSRLRSRSRRSSRRRITGLRRLPQARTSTRLFVLHAISARLPSRRYVKSVSAERHGR